MKYYFLKNYNNYFNRILKKFDTVSEYLNAVKTYQTYTNDDISFNHNDDIFAVIQHLDWLATLFWKPDYMLEVNDNDVIVRRWFVADFIYDSQTTKYNVNLRRDVLADYKDSILNSPCYIEKGYVNDNNPLIFNKEDFMCNQIKISEDFLYDKSHCSWLVAYYDLNEKSELQGSVTLNEPTDAIPIGVNTIDSWTVMNEFKSGKTITENGADSLTIYVDMTDTTTEAAVTIYKDMDHSIVEEADSDTELEYDKDDWSIFTPVQQQLIDTQVEVETNLNTNKAAIKSALSNFKKGDYANTVKWIGKFVKTGNGKIYYISGSVRYNVTDKAVIQPTTVDPQEQAIYNAVKDAFCYSGGHIFKRTGWSGTFKDAISVEYNSYTITLRYTEVKDGTFSYDFTQVPQLSDVPFGMLVFPYKPEGAEGIATQTLDIMNPNLPLRIVQQLALKAGVIKDVQILPYCPFTNLTSSYAGILDTYCVVFDLTTLNNSQYAVIKDNNNNPGTFVLFPQQNKFSTTVRNYLAANFDDIKVENQCTFYRLCSPNWSSEFEFSVAKNGNFEYFNVDCTYQPFKPYIHIAPQWSGLYGRDFGDARGLICGGEFTIPLATSAWETYKLQNKNYQEMFARQIESMDTNYQIDRNKNIANMVNTGVMAGLGTVVGVAAGNPMALMGAAGAAGGLIAQGNNLRAQKQHYEENRDYTIDMHNYQLDNIKALPNTLVGVDAYTNNNKIFPIVEKYSCTDKEKEIFREKLKYEGMTINAMGKIVDYLNLSGDTFIKGQIIRLENFDMDAHMANYIAGEVAQGFYTREIV